MVISVVQRKDQTHTSLLKGGFKASISCCGVKSLTGHLSSGLPVIESHSSLRTGMYTGDECISVINNYEPLFTSSLLP
jgi:hypothetical protein